jgi:hypothetical protein
MRPTSTAPQPRLHPQLKLCAPRASTPNTRTELPSKAVSFKSAQVGSLHIENPTHKDGGTGTAEPQVEALPTPSATEVEESLRRELEKMHGGGGANDGKP